MLEWWHYLLLALPFMLNLLAIWHAYTHEFSTPQERMGWFCLATFIPVIGGLLYFIIGRKRVIPRS